MNYDKLIQILLEKIEVLENANKHQKTYIESLEIQVLDLKERIRDFENGR